MIKLELLISEYKIDTLKEILGEIGITKISTFEVKEYGQKKTHNEGYRGAQYVVDFVTKLNISIILDSTERLDRVLHMLSVANVEAEVFVYEIMQHHNISKRESGESKFSFS